MDQKASAKVLVLDFGAQYGQLIARRVRDLNVYSEIVPCDISADEIREMNASALILSGGPASVYAEDAPTIDPAIFDLGLPILGFCYGHQITAVTLGGKVGHSEVGEYGRATITRAAGAKLFNSTPMEQTVWMSHRDAVSEVPEGFTVTASTDVCPVAAMECVERKIFTTQFHPEVKHSEYGQQLLSNFLFEICGLEPNWSMDNLAETMTADFREKVGRGVEPYFDVSYAFQELTSCLPQGFTVPEGRTKPWGTGHAVLCARDVIDGPFAVINSDDFYGRGAFTAIGGFLTGQHADNAYAMVGYRLHNAMTEHGSVARGVCELRDGYLTGITERTHIEKRGDDAAFTEDGEHFTPLSGDTTVSMNFWGFTPRILDELAAEFPRFLQESVSVNPLKAEFYLPTVANNQLAANRATVRVLHTDESWHGVTYREDLASVQESVAAMHAAGIYPPVLFE